jgi:hypothetical protein
MQFLGRINSLLQQVQALWLGKRPPPADAAPQTAAAEPVIVAGTEPGWLRVLTAPQLLQCVKADKALAEIWRQSRQSEATWQRDLLPAIHRYAEFVQLMPASEAHHHAHAGGLLSHTIEMLLAAMTWRNAHLLPEGSAIEEIDNQRDQWTYVVFFAALLHDIAKPMTVSLAVAKGKKADRRIDVLAAPPASPDRLVAALRDAGWYDDAVATFGERPTWDVGAVKAWATARKEAAAARQAEGEG